MQLQALMMLSAENTQELVTLVPWTFIAQIINLFIQMYLIKKFLFIRLSPVHGNRNELLA